MTVDVGHDRWWQNSREGKVNVGVKKVLEVEVLLIFYENFCAISAKE